MKITWHVPKTKTWNANALCQQYLRWNPGASISSFVTSMWNVYEREYNNSHGTFDNWNYTGSPRETDRYYAFQDLIRDYLAGHESDIANDINDFGELKKVFKIVIGYEAEK